MSIIKKYFYKKFKIQKRTSVSNFKKYNKKTQKLYYTKKNTKTPMRTSVGANKNAPHKRHELPLNKTRILFP